MTSRDLAGVVGEPLVDGPGWARLARWAAGAVDTPSPLDGRPDPHVLGAVHAAQRAGDGLGAVYTPPGLAARVAAEALARSGRTPRVLDPACGGGAFLIEVARLLWSPSDDAASRLRVVRGQLRGWDADPGAVRVARLALAAAVGVPDADLDDVVVQRDALASGDEGTFDVVVGNPPWIDAAAQVAADPGARSALAARFGAARGNWDLFVVFVERALQLLTPRGVHAFVVPDKLATAPYAACARRLLHGTAREVPLILDLRGEAFGAAVRPLAYVCTPLRGEPTVLRGPAGALSPNLPRDGSPWPLPTDADELHLLRALSGAPTLGDLATIRGAATVAEAYALRDALLEGTPGGGRAAAVNSGTIDPLRALWGERPLRYLGRTLRRPVVPLDALPPTRRAQATSPKLVVAGMTRRLEALVDVAGVLAPLKSTTVVLPRSSEDLGWLGGWLASGAATRAWRAALGGLGFRGGYLAVGPQQLARLPVPELAAAARERLAAAAAAGDVDACDAVVDAALSGRTR